jgi:pimeloyl-ACP methyl ester carboxylesterase
MTAAQARGALSAMAAAPGFDAVLTATLHRRYTAGAPFSAPVTVAYGGRDRLLLRRRWRRLDELPPDRRVVDLPGCGHVPMADDPALVTARVLTATGRAQDGTEHPSRGGPPWPTCTPTSRA